MEMFTKEEAFSFVKTKLGVKDAEERIKSDKKALLDDIIVAIQERVPFQNLRLMSIPPQDRHSPTMEEIKSDYVSGIGGLCFTINMSSCYLLRALGFDAAMAHATCTSTVVFRHNHVVVYVSNVVKPGDKFIVELAFGWPTFQAIDLDFEKESPTYVNSYLEYKYIKHEGKILRMNGRGDHFNDPKRERHPQLDFFVGGFRRFYFAETETFTEFAEFEKYNREIYINPKASPFLTSHRFILFPRRKASMVINGNVKKDSGNIGEVRTEATLENDEDIVSAIKQLSPSFPDDIILKSLENWRSTQAKKN